MDDLEECFPCYSEDILHQLKIQDILGLFPALLYGYENIMLLLFSRIPGTTTID